MADAYPGDDAIPGDGWYIRNTPGTSLVGGSPLRGWRESSSRYDPGDSAPEI